MKRTYLMGLIGAVSLLVAPSSRAAADAWTSFFTVDELINAGPSGPVSYFYVKSNSGNFAGANNPANCTDGLYAQLSPTVTDPATRDLTAKTLLSAYLSGTKVSLLMRGGNCSGSGTSGYPQYTSIRLDNDP